MSGYLATDSIEMQRSGIEILPGSLRTWISGEDWLFFEIFLIFNLNKAEGCWGYRDFVLKSTQKSM